MLAKIHSGCTLGIDACDINVETDLIPCNLPSFNIIGLPDASIRESRARIRSAIKNSGFQFPNKKIIINLSPADIKKEGASFDLPIAVGILAASETIDHSTLKNVFFAGELSLNGKLKPIRGMLPLAISLKERFKTFIVPRSNASEAANIKDIEVIGADSLRSVIDHINGISPIKPAKTLTFTEPGHKKASIPDFADVKGQEYVKRGLEVAASGFHNILLVGPPGSGKSMMAKRFPYILSDLNHSAALETTKIYSIAGELKKDLLIRHRPFRSPHHTISYAAMAGGGSHAMPGEISMAHNGVLFLDEFPEFRRDVIETLRQPLESGKITVSRSERTLKYPSRFLLICAMNPCPCGNLTDPKRECRCTPHQIQRYLSKISGPILDRIDIHIEVPRLEYQSLSGPRAGEATNIIKKRIGKTLEIQKERLQDYPEEHSFNAFMRPNDIEKYCILSGTAKELLKNAILELGISARAYDKILKLGRTIADMDGSEIINEYHVSEAIGYRCLDRNLWS